MSRTRHQLLLAVCGVRLLLGMSFTVPAQEGSLATKQLEDVRLSGDTLRSLLADLALRHDIPIGFELAMNSSGGLKETRLKRDKISLADLLTQLLDEYREYSWEISDGVVHVFPEESYRDPIVERLLNVQIGTFSIKKGALTWDVETNLLKTLEFKQVADDFGLGTLGWNFSGTYFPHLGKNYTLDVSDTTARSILDRIVKESPTAKFWSIGRDSSEHTLRIRLDALQEGAPRNPRSVDFDELEKLSYPIP